MVSELKIAVSIQGDIFFGISLIKLSWDGLTSGCGHFGQLG